MVVGEQPALAQSAVVVDVAPPPPRAEVVGVAPTAHHFWIPGYWGWDGGRHVWFDGRWEVARPGWGWERARWAHAGHSWRFAPGRWYRR
jgi:hypothetical protein